MSISSAEYIHQEKLLLEQMFNFMPIHVFLIDDKRNIHFCNHYFQRCFCKEKKFCPKGLMGFQAINCTATKTILNQITATKKGDFCLIQGQKYLIKVQSLEGRIPLNMYILQETSQLENQLLKNSNLSQSSHHSSFQYPQFKSQSPHCSSSPPINSSMKTKSEKVQSIIKLAQRVAKSDIKILIQGETGVGKEVLARLIYENSDRNKKPFVKVNCGAITESLLESELFGYENGAFTGAKKQGKKGLFEQANKGTLFLDEIGELPMQLQVKLLRVLQENEIVRVGGENVIKVDVRIIAATNRNLKEEVDKGRFRMDLFYRLNVVPIIIPPLRDRKEDIKYLTSIFTKKYNSKYEENKQITNEAMNMLLDYHWPGNVRELENFIERCIITTQNNEIKVQHVIKYFNEMGQNFNSLYEENTLKKPLKDSLEDLEKTILMQAIEKYDSLLEMSQILKIDPTTVSRKLKKYGIVY
ncbi:sigma-54 interaction domain-containing protein [Natronincola ferrireducens]|uniref:HTH-type transcriptional regulatory protein TyrR n=1 Tax=Natronincola ferrireducens TaxID=393762 RepID=A0A1G8YNJ5_9FIRM|nr:sigma-54 dependent transcriptional regulator [Natronincola ferrireducens]SDK03685.1 Transcriptional regulator containing PAS, AAA-type ATPase, and DNA-binding Fis domains [Natronincola ferrireducens]